MTENALLTQCQDWNLLSDTESGNLYWWNDTFSITIWNDNLRIKPPYGKLKDDDVWRKYYSFQKSSVYQICPVCKSPEDNSDMFLCCSCGGTVHKECSLLPTKLQLSAKQCNMGWIDYLRCCFLCNSQGPPPSLRKPSTKKESARKAITRALSLEEELPANVTAELKKLLKALGSTSDEDAIKKLQTVMNSFFQSPTSLRIFTKTSIVTKNNGIGVVATVNVPAFTVVGVYPGYADPLSGEQSKLGRPTPRYGLMNNNCADFYNNVFPELQETFTPFINEPNENEESNCAWIQEAHHFRDRLSVITVKEIPKGGELLIGYGPFYKRSYPYRYDAYSFTQIESSDSSPAFSLWHWTSEEAESGTFVAKVKYNSKKNSYTLLEEA